MRRAETSELRESRRSFRAAIAIVAGTCALALAGGTARAQGPEPRPDEVTLPPGSTVVFDVLANDEHPAGLPLRVIDLSAPGAGDALSELRNGVFSFDSAAGPPLPYSFTYQVGDSAGATAWAVVDLEAGGGVYTAPSSRLDLTVEPVDQTTLEIRWSYAGGDADLYRLLRGPDAGSLTLLDTIPPGSGDPDEQLYTDHDLVPGDRYCYQLIVDRASGSLASEPACAVTAPPGGGPGGGPVAVTDFVSIVQGSWHWFRPITDLLANDVGTGLEWVPIDPLGVDTDGGGTLTPWNPTQTTLLYVPPAGDPAADGFSYTIRDASGREATGRVEIEFLPQGTGPKAWIRVSCSASDTTCTFDASYSELGNGMKLNEMTAGAASARLRWDFGDGTCIQANTPACPGVPEVMESHTYAAPGTYPATVTVFDWNAPPGQTEDTAGYPALPGQEQFKVEIDVDCGPAPDWICRLDSAPSTIPSGGATTYQWWLWYDPFHRVLLGETPVIEQSLCGIQSLPCPGTFSVELAVSFTVPGGPTLFGNERAVFVVEDLPPTAAIDVECDTESLSCILDSGGSTDDHGVVAVAWEALSPTGWIPAGADDDAVLTADLPAAGFYTVRLTVTDDAGQAAQRDRIFRVPRLEQEPVAHLMAGCFAGSLGGGTVCELRAGGSYGEVGSNLHYTFLMWPDGVIPIVVPILCPASASPACLFPDPSTFPTAKRALVVVEDKNTGEQGIAERLLLVPGVGDEPPQALFAVECDTTGAQPLCTFDGTPSFDREDAAALAYAWTLNGAAAGSAPVSSQVLPAVGEYDLALTVTDPSGQQDHYSRPLCVGCDLDHPPTARAAPPTCRGSFCRLDATLSSDDGGIVRYLWKLSHGEATSAEGGEALAFDGPRLVDVEIPTGEWTVELTVIDANGQSDRWSAALVANAAPVTVPDAAATTAATAVTVKPLVNDSDPDGDPLTLVDVLQPAHGSIEISLGGAGRWKVRYEPAPGFAGVERLVYTVSDGYNLVDGEITITVEAQ